MLEDNENENENSIEEKQEYLRENILEKGYDANTFADYLVSKRGEEAADLGTWSMIDLIEVVQEFLEKHKADPKKNEENKSEKSDEENKIIEDAKEANEGEENKINEEVGETEVKEESKEKKEEPKKEQKKEQEKQKESALPPEIYGIVLPEKFECKELENTPLSSVEDLVITLSSPEKKEGGFFTKSYVTYLITTNKLDLSVRRRYTDFDWLHQMVLQLYPYVVVPAIPKKNKIGVDKFSDTFINKRMRYLEKFMNWLADNPIIKNSQLLYDFLSIEKDEDFNKKKNEYQKMPTPMNLIDFYAHDVLVDLTVNKEKETYFQNLKDNNYNNEIMLNNLNLSLKQLKIQFDLFIEKVEEVQKYWKILFKRSSKYFDEFDITSTYEKMSKLFTNWADSLKQQNTLIFVNVREHFKYNRNNYREMKTNITNAENCKSEYYKFERNLISRKEDLFKRGEVAKWELDPKEKTDPNGLLYDKSSALFKMCAKETDRCVQRKVYYGYHLNKVIEEYNRIRDYCGIHNRTNLKNFCRRLSEILTEFNNFINKNFTDVVVEENRNKKKKILESKKE